MIQQFFNNKLKSHILLHNIGREMEESHDGTKKII